MKFAKAYLDNRELSWLKFNERVLEEAEDNTVPLFERLRFVSIFCSNLDEFFMIRVGSLHDQTLLKKESIDNKTNLTATEQLMFIDERVREIITRVDKVYFNILNELCRKNFVCHINMSELIPEEERYLKNFFKDEILPLLSPSIIDKRHPVQFLKNKEIYICALLRRKDSEKSSSVSILPAIGNGIYDRVVFLPGAGMLRFVLIENLILHFFEDIFINYTIEKKFMFRITRNADIDVDEALYDYDVDFRDVMEELLKKRRKLEPVRMELDSHFTTSELKKITQKLNLDFEKNFVFRHKSPFDLTFITELENKLNMFPEIFAEKLLPQPSVMVNPNEKILKQLDKGDILLSYPYENFNTFIKLLDEAATDKEVVSIKITLYRVARESKIINALIKAAENGKDILALVELRARFDEENNIGWSKRLEDEGVRVIYGLESLKVHSKLLLITKKTGSAIKYYTQIGTGNYNERTSRLYTDLTLLTADQVIGADASLVFTHLSISETVENANVLLVAPKSLKSGIVEMIDTEITYKKQGYIGLKLNSLTDKDIIEKLVEASCSGVKIELLVRGICCLIAGVKDKTENITVTSVVGRFLEHSRIYIFGNGSRQKVYISSADFMTRNTERRVEVAAPIRNNAIKERIVTEFNLLLTDNIKARDQNNEGVYLKRSGEQTDKQLYFFRKAYENAKIVEKMYPKKEKRSVLRQIINLFKRLTGKG